jgi:dienelactone hydrolase
MIRCSEIVNNDFTRSGYLALPAGGKGVLVLHAWWGLTDFFKQTCDRLAANGFVSFAPVLHHGKTAETIEEAEHLDETRDEAAAQATAEGALRFLQTHSEVQHERWYRRVERRLAHQPNRRHARTGAHRHVHGP